MADFKMATVKSMLNLQMHTCISTFLSQFLSQKHGFCVYSYILMLNESTENIYVYFKCLNMLFKNQSKMAAVKMENILKYLKIFRNFSR